MFTGKHKRTTSRRARPTAVRQRRVKHPIAIPPHYLRWAKLAAVFLIVLGAMLWIRSWFLNPLHWPIEKVEIKGDLKYVGKDTLNDVLSQYVRTNLYQLDDTNLERDLEAMPWVKDVSLRKSWPKELVVNVKEHHPIAYWGENQLLDQHGEVFDGVLPEKREDFPVLYSPEDKGREMGEHYLQVLKWLKDVPLKVVSLVEDGRGSWVLGFENGLSVNIGVQNQEKRLERFVVGYKKVLSKQLEKISLVDLRYTNGFAVEWK